MSSAAGKEPSDRKVRALVIAEIANPEWISVPLEGWCHARALARFAEVHMVTQAYNRENFLKAGLEEGKDFVAIDTTDAGRRLSRLAGLLGAGKGVGWSTLTAVHALSYYTFERRVWERYAPRLRAREFDLVHRLTPLSPTIPSLLAGRCARIGVPFVLGPLNGGVPWPKGFDRARLREREFLSYVRGAHRLLPGYGSTRRHASAIVAGSRETRRQVPAQWQEKTVYIPENGLDLARFGARLNGGPPLPLRAAFVGRLVPYKSADILIEAAAPLVRAGAMGIDVIGDGPELPALRSQAERERLGTGVTFPGWVDHRALQERLARSHVFAFPSVREFGGAVVLEAMATGLVPIVADYGGPAELVSPRTGFVVPMGPRSALVAGFRSVLDRLVADPSGLPAMGRAARERVLRQFTWEAKASQTFEVYRWVLGERGRPDFGMPLPDLE
jgi:alpha-maltose-1-phosphate synthase